MIDGLGTLFRLVLGLASIELVGYGWLLVILPRPSGLTSLERGAMGFGLGALVLTLWMLALTFLEIPFSLISVLAPLVVGLTPGLVSAWRRRLWKNDVHQLISLVRKIITLGRGTACTGMERALLALLLLVFLFAFLRASLYPMWAWDSIATWGLKAKAFYLNGAIDLSRFAAHNYYPNLVPLLMAYLYLWLGGVMDHVVKALFPLWGGCLVLMFYCFLRRLEVGRQGALLGSAFLVLNGTTLIVHLYIAYADLALSYYTLITVGLLLLWLQEQAPEGSLFLVAIFSGGMLWSKYEGWPLLAINFMAVSMTLLWLRPATWKRKFASLALTGVATLLFYFPWRWFCLMHQIEGGTDHMAGFYPAQLAQGILSLLRALVWPPYFGIFWPTVFLAFAWQGRKAYSTPSIFLGLMAFGNLAATVLAYAVVPASAAEFPCYVRATIDRLLLHFTPASGLLLAAPLAAAEINISSTFNFLRKSFIGKTPGG